MFLDSEYVNVVCFTTIDELLDLVRDGNIMANGVVEGSHIVARYCELFVCSLFYRNYLNKNLNQI